MLTNKNRDSSWWTTDRVNRLEELYRNKANTVIMIANIMGISKNAVTGKVKRCNFDKMYPRRRYGINKNTAIRAKKKERSEPNRKVNLKDISKLRDPEPTNITPKQGEPASKNMNVVDLTTCTCHWPHGDVQKGGVTYCGHETYMGQDAYGRPRRSAYCEHHHNIVWKRVQTRKIKTPD